MNLFEIIKSWILEHPLKAGFWTALTVGLVVVWIRHGSRIRRFLEEVRVELSKCIWPVDPEEKGMAKFRRLIDSTIVVILGGLVLAGFILAVDTVLNFGIRRLLNIS